MLTFKHDAIYIIGMGNERGDKAALLTQMPKPHIFLMSIPVKQPGQLSSRKRRQASTEGTCSE